MDNRSRIDRAREAMRERGVDAILASSPGMVGFLTGHVPPAHLTSPSRDGRINRPTLALVTADGAITLGHEPNPRFGEARVYEGTSRSIRDDSAGFAALHDAITELGLRHGTLAVELGHVASAVLLALESAQTENTIVPLGDLLTRTRSVKSPDDVAGLKAACRLADLGQRAVRDATAPAMSELDLYSAIIEAINTELDDAVIAVCEIQVGRRTEQIVGSPTSTRVSDGELVMTDIAPRHPSGWWSDTCSTIVCGDARPEQRKLWQRIHDGLRAGQELLRPGVACAQVHDAICARIGYHPWNTGHGIGFDHFEDPSIEAESEAVLAENMVVVLEPGIYGEGFGMRLEWAFLVTPDGGQPLTAFDLAL